MTRRFIVIASMAALCACGGDETSGHTVVLHTVLTSDLGPDRTFVTGSGWTVTLKKALIATGPLYYFDGEPAFTQARPLRRFWAALSPIGTAYAHPGHYVAGRAVGQMLEPTVVDLLAGPTAVGDGQGITGLVRSATFSFAAPAGAGAAAMAGHVAVTEGAATKGDVTVHFAMTADLTDVERTAKEGLVTGCAFTERTIASEGTVTVTIRPRFWFNTVNFAELPAGSAEAPSTPGPDTIAKIAFSQGLAQLSAYTFAYSP